MTMTPHQIELVQSSFAKVVPIKDKAGELFYGRLFELDPSVKALFNVSITEQGRKLIQVVDVAVSRLSDPETLVPTLEDLGRRHASYGVKAHHYDTVGAALLWTLEQGLGADFTPEVHKAWSETYELLADTMKGAVAEAA